MSAGVSTNNGNKAKGKVRSKKMNIGVDMAPMCDLGFLLITFFMFTTTFSKPNVMHLNMPPKVDKKQLPSHPEIKPNNSMTIILGKNDKVFWYQDEISNLDPSKLNETDFSSEGIRKEIILAQKRADRDKFTIIIKPTDESNYKDLVAILDEMEITNSERYGIKDPAKKELDIYQQKINQ